MRHRKPENVSVQNCFEKISRQGASEPDFPGRTFVKPRAAVSKVGLLSESDSTSLTTRDEFLRSAQLVVVVVDWQFGSLGPVWTSFY